MKWIKDNRGNVIITLAAVVLGVFFGIFTYSLLDRAEAVLGKTGNVSDANNPHNLSSASNSTSVRAETETRICIFCHTPHHAITNPSGQPLLNAPLWNHTLSTETYVINDTEPPYASTRGGIFVNQLTTPIQPDGASRLCLSCHDGTVAVGDIASQVANIAMATHACLDDDESLSPSCSAYIGIDLRGKHVVSIPMNGLLIANSIDDCNNIGQITMRLQYPWDGLSPPNDDVKLRPTTARYPSPSGDYGIDGTDATNDGGTLYRAGYKYGVQCSTCHDPHFWSSTEGAQGDRFLVIASPAGELCEVCHTTDSCPQ